jgi:putative ABC transport system permease protein
MTLKKFILNSLRFHGRSHLGTLLGAAVGSAVLIGALLVGDSVRQSLRNMALMRLGETEFALASSDRFFRAELADGLQKELTAAVAPALQLSATAANAEGSARANRVQALGVEGRFWQLARSTPSFTNIPPGAVVLNQHLAGQLRVQSGDTVVLRLHKPSLLSREAPVSPQEDFAMARRLKVHAVVSDAELGRFSLRANQLPPLNAYLDLKTLQDEIELPGRANLLLAASGAEQEALSAALQRVWTLADAELELRELPEVEALELRSARVFLEEPVVDAAVGASDSAQGILTYFVNEFRIGDRTTPYSMITGIGAPIVPSEMADDEIILNDWVAEDLEAQAGDQLVLRYYVVGASRRLEEKEAAFRVRDVVPMRGMAGDRELLPQFPGVAKAESSRDWDAGFPIDLDRIREKDEEYWKDHRGTPKAFVTLAAAQRLWGNRFGELTAVRYPISEARAEIQEAIWRRLDPASAGLIFEPVRARALAASEEAQDFGQLFLGFSFFLIGGALVLMALLFQFGLEQRTREIGTLLALGFPPKRVRRMLLIEGTLIAFAGGLLGLAGGLAYAKGMLYGLATIWRDAVGTSALEFHATPMTLAIGLAAATLISAATVWIALRGQARRPARELMAEGEFADLRISASGTKRPVIAFTVALVSGLAALALVGAAIARGDFAATGTFFASGGLLLVSGLAATTVLLKLLARGQSGSNLTLRNMGIRNCARRHKRSLATVILLACGSFLIVAVGANKLDAGRDSHQRSSGTGGFALIGESTLPVIHDLNEESGRDFFGLNPANLEGASVVAFRVRDGDDASCLNLNRAQKPRLLGVNPNALQSREAFTFSKAARGIEVESGWNILRLSHPGGAIPAVADEASIVWALGKKIGDTLDYIDEHGRPFQVWLAGAVANSILQGSILIAEEEFVKKFPGEPGYRMFLIDAPSNRVTQVSASLVRALQDAGLELTPAAERLAAFNAVQNTYLNTFQVLGGLGLLLGSAGLGVVVLRNVLERRGELALLLAVGFRARALRRIVLSEHAALLWAGLGLGVISAVVAVLPALLSPGGEIPYLSLGATLLAVFVSGLAWTWGATRWALRGELLESLRNQ